MGRTARQDLRSLRAQRRHRAFDALIEQFMSVEPYASAQRVFVIVDNGSTHRGKRSIDRLQGAWKNLILVHTPVHASWLNQAEIYFSVALAQGAAAQQLHDLESSSARCLRSRATTSRSPNRSRGSSPAPTSTTSLPDEDHSGSDAPRTRSS
jgi:hypothetical protein